MKSRDDVIKGLECCIDYECNVCHYGDDGGAEDGCCSYELKKDALALLKAQEPIVPIRCSAHAHGSDDVWYECGKCGEFLGVNRYSKQFCAKCGRPVKWE